MATSCPHPIDNSFGPWAKQCRGAFDFTLLFEDSILSIPLTCICLLVLPLRLAQLSKSRSKVSLGYLQLYKKVHDAYQAATYRCWLVTDHSCVVVYHLARGHPIPVGSVLGGNGFSDHHAHESEHRCRKSDLCFFDWHLPFILV